MGSHMKLFAFNLFFVIMLNALLSLIPGLGLGSVGIYLVWGGLSVGPWSILGVEIGPFNVLPPWAITLNSLESIALFTVSIVAIITVVIAATTVIVGSSLDFNAFKLLALILGLAFIGAISGMLLLLLDPLPSTLRYIISFPPMVMMVYALIMEIGIFGSG